MKYILRKNVAKVIISSAVVFFVSGTALFAAGKFWQVAKSKHFIVYYRGEISNRYVNKVVRKAEYYYDHVTDYLGYRRFNFWTWDNRCEVYLYKNRHEYLEATGSEEWSRAHVNIVEKKINTYVDQDDFFDTILPHEIGHVVFREFVGFNTELPLCLDEGVACAQEKGNDNRLKLAKAMVGWGVNIPFEVLFKMDKSSLTIPLVFYSESSSILNFLLERFGRDKFTTFCRRVRDGDHWEDALLWIYRFDNMADFEQEWLSFLREGSDPKTTN